MEGEGHSFVPKAQPMQLFDVCCEKLFGLAYINSLSDAHLV